MVTSDHIIKLNKTDIFNRFNKLDSLIAYCWMKNVIFQNKIMEKYIISALPAFYYVIYCLAYVPDFFFLFYFIQMNNRDRIK